VKLSEFYDEIFSEREVNIICTCFIVQERKKK
jgi:hypothetical protein